MENFLSGFKERMRNMMMYYPIFSLRSKEKFKELELDTLGFSVMLYLLENMVMNETKSTEKNIAKFIQEAVAKQKGIHLSEEKSSEVATELLKHLQNDGRPFKEEFFNWEKGETEQITFKLITYENYTISKVRNKEAVLILTNEGLEMLFKTKEVFKELQVSITQLYLRQQIERGRYDSAAEISKDLLRDVRSQQKKMEVLAKRIRKNVLEVAEKNELEEELQRIEDLMKKEKEEFENLTILIEQTIEEFFSENEGKDEKTIHTAMENIMYIRENLKHSSYEHQKLFQTKQEVQKLMLVTLNNMVLNAFSTKINFEKEVLPKLVTEENPNVQGLIDFMRPLFEVNSGNMLHLNNIFKPQRISKEKEEITTEVFELTEEVIKVEKEKERVESERLSKIRKFVLESMILELSEEKPEITLFDVLMRMKNKNEQYFIEISKEKYMYAVLIQLHQQKEIDMEVFKLKDAQFVEGITKDIFELMSDKPAYKKIKNIYIFPKDKRMIEIGKYKIENYTILGGY